MFERDKEKAIKIRKAFLAKEEYIAEVVNVIDEEYESLEDFIYNGLKLSLSFMVQSNSLQDQSCVVSAHGWLSAPAVH